MLITFLGNFEVDYSSETHHKKSLEALGHSVIPMQERLVTADQVLQNAINSDMFVWVHTHGWNTPGDMVKVLDKLKEATIPTLTYHLDLWLGLEREKDLSQDEFYKHIGHFFATDKLMADWFNENTDVKGHYLPAGVLYDECFMAEPDDQKGVIFVGSKGYHPEWPYRPQLINWLRDTYGDQFTHVGGDGDTGTIRGYALNKTFANSKVTVGDTLCLNFDYPYYWSDRVYETLGRGGFLIMPRIKGLEDTFEDGKHMVLYKYGDFGELKHKIDYYLEHDDEREAIRKAGHELVTNNHTYKNRWEAIINEAMYT